MSEENSLGKALRKTRARVERLESAIRLLRYDVDRKRRESEPGSTYYASDVDLIDTLMREHGVLYP